MREKKIGNKCVWFGKTHTTTTKEKMSRNNIENVSCVVDDKVFRSMSEAGRYFNIHRKTVFNRISSKNYPTWNYYYGGVK